MPPTSPPSDLLATALLQAHRDAGAKLVPFAGWEMPLDYGSILEESRAVRTSAGLFDVSHMGRLWFRGPDAAAELDAALGGRVTDQPVGKARYTLLLNERGTIIDDLLTYRTGENEYFMVVNASNRAADVAALQQRMGTTTLEDITMDGGGILALQGPEARRILSELAGTDDFCRAFLDLANLEVNGVGKVFIARTGYTGEHGYELFATAEQMQPLWDKLLAAGAAPVGLGARDVLRLEAALPLYGHEIHDGTSPFDAGLRFAIKGWKTRTFVGSDALPALSEPTHGLVGLFAEKRVPRQGYPVLGNGERVGEVCSGVWSATLDRPIAIASVALSAEGPFTVDIRGRELPVETTSLPFVPHRSREAL